MALQPNLPPPTPPSQSMDWFSWLSGTGLEPVLIYKYGIVLTRNELQAEDISYFDHEFLWSMGIAVAKHRLEIVKLARKEKGGGGGAAAAAGTRPRSGFVAAISRTKKSFAKYMAKLAYHQGTGIKASSKDPGKLLGKHEDDITASVKWSNLGFSSPLVDSRVQDRHLPTKHRNTTWSSPLYPLLKSPPLLGNLYPVGSPRLSGRGRSSRLSSSPRDSKTPSPKGVYDHNSADCDVNEHSLWVQLFHDMKPT